MKIREEERKIRIGRANPSAPTLRKRPPSSEQREYIFWAPSSCCCSHMASRSSSSFTNPARSWHTWTDQSDSQLKPPAPQRHINEQIEGTPMEQRLASRPYSWCRCPRRGPRTARSGSMGGGGRRCGPAGPAAARAPAALLADGTRPRTGCVGLCEGRSIYRVRVRRSLVRELTAAAAAAAAPFRSFWRPVAGRWCRGEVGRPRVVWVWLDWLSAYDEAGPLGI